MSVVPVWALLGQSAFGPMAFGQIMGYRHQPLNMPSSREDFGFLFSRTGSFRVSHRYSSRSGLDPEVVACSRDVLTLTECTLNLSRSPSKSFRRESSGTSFCRLRVSLSEQAEACCSPPRQSPVLTYRILLTRLFNFLLSRWPLHHFLHAIDYKFTTPHRKWPVLTELRAVARLSSGVASPGYK